MFASRETASESSRKKIFKQASEDSRWYQAIRRGNCAEVMQLLRNDAKPLQKTGYEGRTALHAAVIGGWGEAAVQEVLEMCKSGRGSASSSSQQSVVLRDLLDARDEKCHQTALTMAVIIGNGKVVRAIMRAYATDYRGDDVRLDEEDEKDEVLQHQRRSSELEQQRKQVKKEAEQQRQQDGEAQQRQQLRDIVPALFQKCSHLSEYTELLKYHCRQVTQYRNEGEEYLLHSMCRTSDEQITEYIETNYAEPEVQILRSFVRSRRLHHMHRELMETIVNEAKKSGPSLVPFLFKLQDNWGMTPLHAAVRRESDYPSLFEVLKLIPEGEGSEECVNAPDGAGRTPLHRVAAQSGYFLSPLEVLLLDPRTDVNARFRPFESFQELIDVRELRKLVTPSEADLEYESGLTALHLAILHSQSDRVRLILKDERVEDQICITTLPGDHPRPSSWMACLKYAMGRPLNLAVIMGEESTIRELLKIFNAAKNLLDILAISRARYADLLATNNCTNESERL